MIVEITVILYTETTWDSWSLTIDNAFDRSFAIQENNQRISKSNAWSFWCCNSGFNCNTVIPEVRVSSNSNTMMLFDVITYFKCNIASVTIILLSHIIWEFWLIEIWLTILSIPNKHITKGMFTCETVSCYIITIN